MYQQVARAGKIEANRPKAMFWSHVRSDVAVAFHVQRDGTLLVEINNGFFEFTPSYKEYILFRVSFVFG